MVSSSQPPTRRIRQAVAPLTPLADRDKLGQTMTVVLSVVAGAFVALAISAGHAMPAMTWLVYIFKPLSTTLLVTIAAAARRTDPPLYRWGVVTGLVCSLAGDVLLMMPRDHFIAGLMSFLGAHVCYIVAFTSDCRIAARRTPFLAWATVGAALLLSFYHDVPEHLRACVILYATFILTMAAQATARALALKTPSAMAACVGATLFVLSDALLATARFRGGLPWSDVMVLVPYFSGQWLIAVSVTFCPPARDRFAAHVSAPDGRPSADVHPPQLDKRQSV